jgi:hypothetical protein
VPSSLTRFVALAASAFIAVAAGGCAASDDDTGETEADVTDSAILGGGVERGYTAVGAFSFEAPIVGSGVLVAPNVVLTAAHVASGNPKKFHFGVAPNGGAPTRDALQSADVAEVKLHPCTQNRAGDDCAGRDGDPVDVALVRLTAPVRGVAPAKIVDQPMERVWGLYSPYEDYRCVAVGFGAHVGTDGRVSFAARRSARVRIDEVGAAELVTVRETGIATGGDSGGPLFCANEVVGVVRGSAGAVPRDQPYLRTREAYERIDLHRRWIADQIAAWKSGASGGGAGGGW